MLQLFLLLPTLLLLSPFPLRPLPILPSPTITASRDHPGAADSCPLNLPDNFFRAISAACTPAAATTPLPDLCCPALAAWLYAAYSAAALATRLQPSAARSYDDLPALPGDSEPCAAAAEAALRARGVRIPGSNDTCGAAACACGVGLHPLQCPGPFVVAGGGEGRWVPEVSVAGKLEAGCSPPAGVAGCARCLRTLNQLRSKEEEKGKSSDVDGDDSKRGRECQLMGLTWLLSINRTRYLPTAVYVLRAFRTADAGGGYPATCSDAGELPLAVGYEQLLGTGSFNAAQGLLTPAASTVFLFLLVMLILNFKWS